MADSEISIGANSVQLLLKASGLIGEDGFIRTNLMLRDADYTIGLPVKAFPFIDPNTPVIVMLGIVQVRPRPKPSALLIPGQQ